MEGVKHFLIAALIVFFLTIGVIPAGAAVVVQCPEDTDGDGVPDIDLPNVECIHLSAGDGFVTMADGKVLYIFSFSDVTDVPADLVLEAGMLAAESPAPTIAVTEGDELYLNLSNVGMMVRPDLFDPHTVHWHGFPNASAIFDGVPEASVSINMGATLTYYYKVPGPGTYMYHCHVEATEHMQMGMLGNLYVRPLQDNGPPIFFDGRIYSQFAYNDGDGSTGYDMDYPIQIGSFDPVFHDASELVQPLPFALMHDTYPLLNGRGYPDTNITGPLAPPVHELSVGHESQKVSSLIEATKGERILLRISNLNVTNFYTLATLGIPMQVVGFDAKHLRSEALGENLYFKTNSVTLGGGQAVDAILDTSDVPVGTYFLYTTNLNYLNNNEEDFGGMIAEIRIN